ncbi:MAG: ATP-binding cassette domain-containing protein [Pseudomonadota bacterium]
MNQFAIETSELCVRYRGKLALDRLSFQLPYGGIHAVIGANGAGKSTLFRTLLGFQRPSSGHAFVLGARCTEVDAATRGRIGFVNDGHTLPGWMRIDELVAMQRSQYHQWSEQAYNEVIRNFFVRPDQRIAQLSRGERAGVNLAMALAQRPELLILDEPTLGLDVVAKRAFLEALTLASYDNGTTTIYCSHQMEEVERIADNLIILERGALRHMSSAEAFCAQVTLWIAEFPFAQPDLDPLPGVLEIKRIDGLTHVLVFGQGPEFGARLQLLGARGVDAMPVNLDRAVNGVLTRGHAGTLNTQINSKAEHA